MNENITLQSNKLTQSQTLLWTGQMLHPQSPMYNMVMTFELLDSINIPAFKAAFQALVNDSDIMRTVILSEGGRPQQIVKNSLQYNLEYIDLSRESEAETTFKAWLKTRSEQNFDLSQRLFDSAIIQFSEKRFVWYFNQHHILTDGWSLTILYKEMAKLYALALENALATASKILPFQSYLNFEKGIRNQTKKETITQYWKDKLKSLPTPPRLYGKAGEKNSSQSKRILVDLGTERSEALRALTKEKDLRAFTQDMSLFNIFSTVLFAYLKRVSGQDDLLIGAPSHNRPTADFKKTPGVFIEIFPMQTEVGEDDTFMDLFRKVRIEASGFLRNAQSGYSSPALSGSFNVFLNYITGNFGDFNGIPMRSEWILPGHADPAHHLRVQIHDFDSTGDIKIHFDFNTSVFDDEMCQNAPQHFLRLLDAFIADRNQTLSNCNILSAAEKQYLLYDLNKTDKDYQSDSENLLTLFDNQVKKTPNALALAFGNELLTYTEFNEKANQIGRFLASQSIGNEHVVALIMERSMEMPLAIYGILKAGAAYLPIDSKTPTERINFMLQDADVQLVFTQNKLKNHLNTDACRVVSLDESIVEITSQSTENLPTKSLPNSLAYVIYTSGSTGKPKGVAIEHRSICNRMSWMRERVTLTEKDVYLQKTPYTFDVSVPEFFWALQTGGQLVMAQPDEHKNPAALVKTIQDFGVTNLHFVPSMLSVFLEEKGLEDCTTLNHIYATGEAISDALQRRFYERFDIPLFNMYGPTEAAVEVTCWECKLTHENAVVPIGKPEANIQFYILNENLQAVPQGTPGELYIGGVQVARGYLNRPELTKSIFINDPFRPDLGTKIYRTGDLARHRSDGIIEYLGRVDFQVKLRGFRIELGEIETRMEEYSSVTQAVVLMRKDASNNQHLIAFYTGEKQLSGIPFIHHLATRLPEYMIPKHFVHLEEFPLGTSGKVNRKALPNFEVSEVKSKITFVAPSNQIEELVAEIWQELLEVERIGIHENFTDLGGHSLTAIRLVSRIADSMELQLPIDLVFKKSTIASYAAHIEETIVALLAEEE